MGKWRVNTVQLNCIQTAKYLTMANWRCEQLSSLVDGCETPFKTVTASEFSCFELLCLQLQRSLAVVNEDAINMHNLVALDRLLTTFVDKMKDVRLQPVLSSLSKLRSLLTTQQISRGQSDQELKEIEDVIRGLNCKLTTMNTQFVEQV